MAEARELSEAALGGRVYRDEPIAWGARPVAHPMPRRYREMRGMAGGGVRLESDARLFYEQGKFMEDFEDDFDYRGGFVRHAPTYQAMTDAQLRGYFSWRAAARRGVVGWTPPGFAFLYVYELLNQIGARTPEEGFQALQNFRAACGRLCEPLDLIFPAWLRDYVVYYDLGHSLLGEPAPSDFERAAQILLSQPPRGEEETFAALNALSAYDITGSRFFGQYPEEVKGVVCRVYARLLEQGGESARANFLGVTRGFPHALFQSAVFCDPLGRRDFVYEVSAVSRYRCERGRWRRERLFPGREGLRATGALLKTIDRLMRLRYGFKPPLKALELAAPYQEIIREEVERRWAARERAAGPVVAIDLSKLRGIREAALETQNKLIVESPCGGQGDTVPLRAWAEPTVLEASKPHGARPHHADSSVLERSLPQSSYGGQGDTVPLRGLGQSPKVCALTDEERRLLTRLLGEAAAAGGGPSAPMLSVLVDGINEKLLDAFGDTVVACEGEEPALIEDYRDELRRIIEE